VVPHAGWRYSGAVAARALRTLREGSRPRIVIVFGAVHREHLEESAVYPSGAWETPAGSVPVAEDLAAEVLRGAGSIARANPGAHRLEHSIEVELPLIEACFPGASVLPIMVPPGASPVELGRTIARLVRESDVVALASSDLTHYGERFELTPAGEGESAHAWMRANDQRILGLASSLDAERIVPEALEHRNACGSGALAALAAFARELGSKRGHLLERTDSHEVSAKPGEPFESAVGYAGMVF